MEHGAAGAGGVEGHLVAWLDGRDVACPVCSYNLRDLKASTCPECSAPLVLAVASPNLNMAPWFVSVVALALGAGFDGVVSVLMTCGLIVFPPKPQAMGMVTGLLTTFVVLTCVCITLLVMGYRARRRWAFWSRKRQWGTALAIFGATGLGHGIVGIALMWLMR
jgi:hypothetical protein